MIIPNLSQYLTHHINIFMVATIYLAIICHKCHMKFLFMDMNTTHRLGSIQTTQFMDCRLEEINQYTLDVWITTFVIMLLQYLDKIITPIKMRSCLMYSNLWRIHFGITFIVLYTCIISSLYYKIYYDLSSLKIYFEYYIYIYRAIY